MTDKKLTNGEMIMALFPNGKVIDRDGTIGYEILIDENYSFCSWYDGKWWKEPYKQG